MVVENLCRTNIIDDIECKYSYRMTENEYKGIQAYGIEIERLDYAKNLLVNIERDNINLISPQRKKVENILNILYDNNVSPIHLVDIIGGYVDEYVCDFNM